MNKLFQNIQALSEKIQFISTNDSFNNSNNKSLDNSAFLFANPDSYISYNARLFLIMLHCVTSLVALIGNGWVIAVALAFYRSSPFQHIKKYLINLAVSDIAIAVLCVPFTYSDFIYGQWIFPVWLCPVAQYVQLVGVFVTTNTLMIIGIERYTAVRHPFSKFHQKIQSHSYIMICFIWILALYYAYMPMGGFSVDKFMIGNQTYQQCNHNVGLVKRLDRHHYMMANFGLTFALPAAVLAFTYLEIARKVLNITLWNKFGMHSDKQQKIKMQSIKHNLQCELLDSLDTKVSIQREKNKNKVSRITLITIVLFVLCWMPIKLFELLIELNIVSYSTEQQYSIQLYIYIGCHWLAMSSTIVNPVLYSFLSHRYWEDQHNFLTFFRALKCNPK